ncbi:MAG TPA: hypothetical protein VL860_05320 [Planctomycetota bacterium]|nr:hypothetical protein [Planctomycetota bacterium]
MKKYLGAVCLAAAMLVSGCSSDPTYATPAMMTPHKDQPIMYAGSDLAERVPLANDGIMEKRTATGQLELTLKFVNVGPYPESILVKVQFLEQDGSMLDNDKKTDSMTIEPQETKPMVILSNTLKAAKYNVQVLKHSGGPPPEE